MSSRFLRQDWMRHSRIGKGRKKLQKWRRPRGRHSKIRRKRFGYPPKVMIGYSSPKSQAGLIQGLKPVLVHNMKELQSVDKSSIVILSRVGAKLKMQMIKFASEKGIKIMNMGGKR